MSEPLVIVGNGMAAARLVEELTRVALGRYALTRLQGAGLIVGYGAYLYIALRVGVTNL